MSPLPFKKYFYTAQFQLIFGRAQYWIDSHYTRNGKLIISVIALSLMISLDANNSNSYYLACLGFTFVALSHISTKFISFNLTADRIIPQVLLAQTENDYQITVRNLGGKPLSDLFVQDSYILKHPEQLSDEERSKVLANELTEIDPNTKKVSQKGSENQCLANPIPTIPPYSKINIRLTVNPIHRGLIFYDQLVISRPDAFGLCFTQKKIRLKHTSIVKPHSVPNVRMEKRVIATDRFLDHQFPSQNKGVGEFSGLKPYEIGDNLRRINWREFSKTNNLVVKEFDDNKEKRHLLIIDNYQEKAMSEAIDESLSICLSLINTMTKSDDLLLDVLHVDGLYKHGADYNHSNRIALFLSLLPPSDTDNFSAFLDTLINGSYLADDVIIVMSGNDTKRKEFLKKLVERKHLTDIAVIRNKYAILPAELLDKAMISELRLNK